MIRRELILFAINGLISVAIAFTAYLGLVASGMLIEFANALAYLAGIAYGFSANKRFTFCDGSKVSTGKVARYALLHTFTLLINIGVNSALISIMIGMQGGLSASFLGAIAVSTVLNFLGLKYWVFKPSTSNMAR